MLTRENYTAWALKMKVYLKAQGVWAAVKSKDPKAVVEDKTDKVALAMIYQGISEEILLSIAEKETTKDAWEAIKTLCQGADRVKSAKVQTLRTEFEALSMKDDESIDDFHMKMNGIITNIRALGEEMSEAYTVKKFLRAVPPKFLQITSTLEQFGDLENLTVEEAVASLKAYEERVKGKSEEKESKLLLTEEEWAKRERNEGKLLLTRDEWIKKTNREGTSEFRNRGLRDKKNIRYFNCGIYGHFAAECRKPKKFKEIKQESNLVQVEDDEPTLLLAKHVNEEPKPSF